MAAVPGLGTAAAEGKSRSAFGAYRMFKAGVIALAQSLSTELGLRGAYERGESPSLSGSVRPELADRYGSAAGRIPATSTPTYSSGVIVLTTGRTSIAPKRASGHREAISIARSKLDTSTMM